MPIPVYSICKAKGSTIDNINCETTDKKGQVLKDNIVCRFKDIKKGCHYHFKIKAEKVNIKNKEFKFEDREINIKISIMSRGSAKPKGKNINRTLCILKENLKVKDNEKFSLEALSNIDYGIKVFDYEEDENKNSEISLDYIRSNLFEMDEFKGFSDTSELNENIHKYITECRDEDADIYIYGDVYPVDSEDAILPDNDKERKIKLRRLSQYGPEGVHNIHMNQGNKECKHLSDNGIYQDGGILIHFKSENRWSAIFTRFESQCIETNNIDGCCQN
jgi:uncharacterized protein YukJ